MRRLWWVGVVLLPLGVAVGLLAGGSGARLLDQVISVPGGCGATTQAASNVTQTSATLHGVLGDAGNEAPNCGQWSFDYGPTIAYGSTTPTGDAFEGSGIPVTADLTGLTPNTTYHFRLHAESGFENVGDDVTFHTLSPPPPATPNPTAALALTNTVSPAAATTGTNVTFTIVVSNGGPAAAGQTVVRDTFSAGLTPISATSTVGSCNGTPTVTCTVGVLAAGTSATITIIATAVSAGTYSNTASVDSPDAARPQTTAAAGVSVTTPPPATSTATAPTTPTTTSPSAPPGLPGEPIGATSIGGISIGDTEQAVEKVLGPPSSTLGVETAVHGNGKLARYRAHGALFLVTYDEDGHVVQLETYSPAFRTENGAGPGASLTLAEELPGFHHDPCELGYWNGTAGTKPTDIVTVFTPNGGLIASVLITEFAYYTACQGGGHELPPAITLDLNDSIGGVSIGMSEADVVKLFGKPRSSLDVTLGAGLSGTSVRYRVHGAPFLITFDQHGRVVSLESYSPFFRTADNLGPGSALLPATHLKGFRPDSCELGYWNWRPGYSPSHIVTVFTPNGGFVASVIITQLRLYTACAAGSTELSPQ